jgi:hypothetical protein
MMMTKTIELYNNGYVWQYAKDGKYITTMMSIRTTELHTMEMVLHKMYPGYQIVPGELIEVTPRFENNVWNKFTY